MKKTIYSLCGVLLAACLCFSAKANSESTTNSVCFNDGFYNWNITYTGSAGSYTCTGTVNVDGTNWSVWGSGNFSSHMGNVEFHASNPNADGCQSGYTDSFTYWGNAQIMGNGSGTTFTGGGNWTSYCSGGIYSTGTWSANGPCGALKSLPYGPAKHAANTAKNASNSVCFNDGFYNWNITYTDQGGGNYSVTGSLNVDGNIWPVWGSGNFAGRMGNVEFHASNPNADGCQSGYTDSFTYWGNAQIMGNGSGTTFTGDGSWTSYCSGGIYSTGTWAAQGPCGTLKSLPYGPAKHAANTAKNASNSVCFNDGFYNWKISYTDQGGGNYSVSGSLNVDGNTWPVWGSGNFAGHMGTVELHASNPNPDGCVSYSDSFTYWGNAQIMGNGSGTTFMGSGNWTSYCYGGVLFTGTWAAQGPCGALKSLPYGPAKHGNVFSMKISPNPLKSSSVVTYSLAKQSQISITVYNYMQQPVKQVVNKTESAGKHSYVIDGSSLTNGIYRVVAVVDGKSYTSSLQVVR